MTDATKQAKEAAAELQDRIARQILSAMGSQRTNASHVASMANISASYFSEMMNLRKPVDLNRLIRIAKVLGLEVSVSLKPIERR